MKQRFSIFSSFSTVIVFVLFAIVGAVLLHLIPLKLNPTSNLPSISVSVGNYQLNANDVEEQITTVLESAVATVSGVKSIQSQSNKGQSSVQLSFDKYVDIEKKRFEILSAVRRIYPSLPEETSFPSVQIRSAATGEFDAVLQYNIISEREPSEVAELVERFAMTEFVGLEEVHDIQLSGYVPSVYEIEYDFKKMQNLGVSVTDFLDIIEKLNTRIFIGKEEQQENELTQKAIIVENVLDTPKDIGHLAVSSNEGKLIRIQDFATIKQKSDKPRMYYRVNGTNTLGIGIVPAEGVNQLALAEMVKGKIAAFQKELPGDIEIILVHDGTEVISNEVSKLVFCTLLTLVILFLFIYVSSRDFRHVLVLLFSFVLTISAAFLIYYLVGVELHLFSFAGLTISFGMLLDDSIMMIEHLKCSSNKNIIRSIFASSLTTVAALSAIFFLDDATKLKLYHFALVVIINLGLSSLSSLFLVPALIDLIKPATVVHKTASISYIKRVLRLSRIYRTVISRLVRFRKLAIAAVVLGFGLPVFLLPQEIKSAGFWADAYNATIGHSVYQYKYREWVDVFLGGALFSFVNNVEHGEFAEDRKEIELRVTGQFPKGTKIEQVNEAFLKLETYLKQFNELKNFFCYIDSPESGMLLIRFKKEYATNHFPNKLSELLSSYVIELGSAEWDITGADDGFSNNMRERAGANKIYLYGFNYEELKTYASAVKRRLEKNMRVESVHISAQDRMFRDENLEYTMSLKKDKIAESDIPIQFMLPEIQHSTVSHHRIATVRDKGEASELYMTSKSAEDYDRWLMQNYIFTYRQSAQKIKHFGTIEQTQLPEGIVKRNQQYQLVLDFDYIGDEREGRKLAEQLVESLSYHLNTGFTASLRPQRNISYGRKGEMSQTWLLVFAVIGIYLICAVLFESLLYPLIVILLVPFSFTGVFVSFSLFGYKFDQGGYASFFLLTGLTVNAVIYIINERNTLKDALQSSSQALNDGYFKAVRQKIIPIFYTIVSTSLGLIPFLLMGESETFWFPLALGTISGLIFSLFGILFILPLFFIKKVSI